MSKLMTMLLVLWLPQLLNAQQRLYQAKVEQSEWVAEGDKFFCRLTHGIPLFGQGVFELKASLQANLEFRLLGRYLPQAEQKVDVRSIAGTWSPGDPSRHLLDEPMTGAEFSVHEPWSRTLLTELEQGRFIRLFFNEANTPTDELDVALSPINFLKAYGQFQQCMAALLPFGFKDIEHSPIRFEFDKYDLTVTGQKQLERIVQYIEAQGPYKEIWIYGHTDSKGTDAYNDKLGELRAQTIKQALYQRGIAEDKLQIKSFGKKQPVKSNQSAQGRAQNRRAEVRVVRDEAGL